MTFIPQPLQPSVAYYATAGGGRLAFNITTGIDTITGTGERPFALLENPTGSGKDCYLDVGEFASSVNTIFRRYSGPTVSGRTTAIVPANLTGGATASVLRMYDNNNFTVSANGTVRKTAHIRLHETYFTQLNGRAIVRPGNAILWTIDKPSGGADFTGSIYFEFYELPAQA